MKRDRREDMKSAIVVTLITLLVGCADAAPLRTGTSEPAVQFSVDSFEGILIGMTRSEVRKRLGEPAAVRAGNLPKGPFWGPHEGIDINALNSLREYEEWRYEDEDSVYLIWFGDRTKEKIAWRTIGKTSYPRGAVF